MNSKKFYFVMLGLVGLLCAVIVVSAIFGSQLLEKKSEDLVALKLESAVIDAQGTSLVRAKEDIAKYSELNQEARVIVPQDKDQAQAVREIVKIASDSGIKLSSIDFPTSSLGSTSKKSSSSSSSSNSSKLTQVTPVPGITGLYAMKITVQQQVATNAVSYNSFINFLSKLEKNRRTAQVTGVTIQPSDTNPDLLTFSLELNVYIKP